MENNDLSNPVWIYLLEQQMGKKSTPFPVLKKLDKNEKLQTPNELIKSYNRLVKPQKSKKTSSINK